MEPFGTIQDHMVWDHTGPYGTKQDHSGLYWTTRDYMKPYRTILDHMGPYGSVWDHKGPYRTIRVRMGPYRAMRVHIFVSVRFFANFKFVESLTQLIIRPDEKCAQNRAFDPIVFLKSIITIDFVISHLHIYSYFIRNKKH